MPFKTKRAVAAEMFAAAVCNLDCKYCYIPKTEALVNMHRRIVESYKDGTFISAIRNTYGDNIENLSMWGTEPTLILSDITPLLPTLLEEFPKLNSFSFSTNMISNVRSIIDFIKFMPRSRHIKINIQVSIDGPNWITDNNRGSGATENIEKNVKYLFSELSAMDLNNILITSNTKTTWGIDNLKTFSLDKSRLRECLYYLRNFSQNLPENLPSEIRVNYSACGTLAVPGKYTSEDGRTWAKVCRFMTECDEDDGNPFSKSYNSYNVRFLRLMSFFSESYIKPSMFTCSGGDSNWSIEQDGNIHMCHRTLFGNHEEYLNEIIDKKIENWDITNYDRGAIDMLNQKYIVNSNNQIEVDRISYTLGGYHNQTAMKEASTISMLSELALCGQASRCYVDRSVSRFLSLFINSGLSCPAENLINTGSIHITPLSILRLFANGAFEHIFSDYLRRNK